MVRAGRGGGHIFLSTPSVGRATGQCLAGVHDLQISIHALRGEGDAPHCLGHHSPAISIHALRGEGDVVQHTREPSKTYFYPRPPWGGRQAMIAWQAITSKFLSTPSVGRATIRSRLGRMRGKISIHALRGEGDRVAGQLYPPGAVYFYPRPPWGGRL